MAAIAAGKVTALPARGERVRLGAIAAGKVTALGLGGERVRIAASWGRGDRGRRVTSGGVDPAGVIAGRQRGVVTRAQLRAAGLSVEAIDRRLRAGRLHRVHRGVYLVGHGVFPPHARELAALLACGRGAVLSHLTAAALWRIVGGLPEVVDVTVRHRARRQRGGIRIHRTSRLDRGELRVRDAMPVTAPERTILDLASMLPARDLARAVDEARALGLAAPERLRSLVVRAPRRRGAARLRALLDAEREPALTRSEAERRMVDLIERGGLPRPRINGRVAGHEVDLHWPGVDLVVEVDGYAFHSRPADFERDHRREQDLAAAGMRISRVSRRQLVEEPEAVLVRLARALDARRHADP